MAKEAPKDCTTCRHANWRKTANGRLHPNGDGKCEYRIPPATIPKAFFWSGFGGNPPAPSGGYIRRKDAHSDCPTYQAKEPQP